MVPGCPGASRALTVLAYEVLVLALSVLPGRGTLRTREPSEPSVVAEDDFEFDESLITVSKSCYETQMDFDEFCTTYGRKYTPGTGEYLFRKGLFELHTAAAQMQNCKLNSKWTAGVNAHADWTEDELASLRGYKRLSTSRRGGTRSRGSAASAYLTGRRLRTSVRRADSVTESFPEAISWSHLVAIQTPRDQGQCGSCWAHSAETVMRAHSEIYAVSQNFSVEELISCVANPQECGGQGGCLGATIELAYDYVMRNGLSVEAPDSEASESIDEVACPLQVQEAFGLPIREVFLEDGREVHTLSTNGQDAKKRGMSINMYGWTKLPENREEPLVRALVEMGPVAVAVAAGWQWNLYKAGIMSLEDSCEDHTITHAIVLFGYGSEDGERYWHLKNSWGSWWGESGNIRMQRSDSEGQLCGWDMKPEVGTGCLGGPPQVWVCGSCGILYDTSIPHFRPLDIPAEEDEPASVW